MENDEYQLYLTLELALPFSADLQETVPKEERDDNPWNLQTCHKGLNGPPVLPRIGESVALRFPSMSHFDVKLEVKSVLFTVKEIIYHELDNPSRFMVSVHAVPRNQWYAKPIDSLEQIIAVEKELKKLGWSGAGWSNMVQVD